LGRGVRVTINLIELEKMLGDRTEEIATQLVEKISERCFRKYGFTPYVEEKLTSISIYNSKVTSVFYGFIEREVEEIESNLFSKLGFVIHAVSIIKSKNKIPSLKIALYRLKEKISRGDLYKKTALASRSIRKVSGFDVAPYRGGVVALILTEDIEVEDTFKIDAEWGSLTFEREGTKELALREMRDREFLKKVLNEKAREKLRKKGFLIDGLQAFFAYSSIASKPVIVRRGMRFQSLVWRNGYVGYALSPALSVEARHSLAEDPSQAVIGCRVRRMSDGISGFLREVGDVCVFYSRGLELKAELEDLVRIYEMKDLEELGLVNEVLRISKEMQSSWSPIVNIFLDAISGIVVGGEEIFFENEFFRLEV